MRRGSLVGPLIIILIGVVFLLKNIRPDLPLFDIFMTYWPFLLIAWGGLRLVEILFQHFRGGKVPCPGISGGEWVLIIILSCVGGSVWGVQHLTRDGFGRIRIGGEELFGESFDYPVEMSKVQVPPACRVVIDNVRGNTKVTGAEIDEVRVSGRKTIRALDRGAADKANEQSRVGLNKAGDIITISGNQDRAGGPRVTEDLEVVVPKGASVETRGRYGDLDVSDVNGGVNISSDNAGVRLQNIGGLVKVDLRKSDIIRAAGVKGDVELKGRGRDIELEDISGQVVINGSYSGETSLRRLAKPLRFESPVTEFRVEKVPGELQLSLSALTGSNLVGPMVVRAKKKDVRLTDVTESIDIDVDISDVEIRQSKAAVKTDIKVRSGDIELALPQQAKFTLSAQTERGNATNDFDPRLKLTTENHGGKISGSLGAGPEIKALTSRGELTVRKMSAAEAVAPPEAPAAPKAPKPAVAPPRADNQ